MEPSGRDWALYEAAPGLGAGPRALTEGQGACGRAGARRAGRSSGEGETSQGVPQGSVPSEGVSWVARSREAGTE